MRQLMRKEWRENRLVPVWIAAVLALLEVALWKLHAFDGPGQTATYSSGTLTCLYGSWIFAGIFAGAGLISREVGSGSLSFLMALPVTRRRVWWNKLSVAIGVLAASMLLTTAVWAILQPAFFTRPFSEIHDLNYAGCLAAGAIASLGLAMAVSTVLDRAISTAMVSIVAAIAWFIVFSFLSSYCQVQGMEGDPVVAMFILPALAAPPAFFASYWAFTRGESLRSFRRFWLLLAGAALGALMVWIPCAAGYEWMAAFRPTGDQVHRVILSPDGNKFAADVMRNHLVGKEDDPDSYVSYHVVAGSVSSSDRSSLQVFPGGKPMALSPDGRYLVYCPTNNEFGVRFGYFGGATPLVCDLRTGQSYTLRHSGYAYPDQAAWSSDGRWLALCSPYGGVLLYDSHRLPPGGPWKAAARVEFANVGFVDTTRLLWTADNRYLIVSGDHEIFAMDPRRVKGGSVEDPPVGPLPRGIYGLYKGTQSASVELSQDSHRALLEDWCLLKHGARGSMLRSAVVDLAARIKGATAGQPPTPAAAVWRAHSGSEIYPGNASISPDGQWVLRTVSDPDRQVTQRIGETTVHELGQALVPGKWAIKTMPASWLGRGHRLYAWLPSDMLVTGDAEHGITKTVPLNGQTIAGSTPDGSLLVYKPGNHLDVRHLLTRIP